eukprot:2515256-Rhodomonas_salina.1
MDLVAQGLRLTVGTTLSLSLPGPRRRLGTKTPIMMPHIKNRIPTFMNRGSCRVVLLLRVLMIPSRSVRNNWNRSTATSHD